MLESTRTAAGHDACPANGDSFCVEQAVGTDAGTPAAFIRGLSGAQVEAFAVLAT